MTEHRTSAAPEAGTDGDPHLDADAQAEQSHGEGGPAGGHGEGGHGGGHGGGHRRPHGKHGGHGGHSEGGNWIVTYCDMITLLIAFFICILTFASKESGKQAHAKLRDSILYGPGGSGAAGPSQKGGDQDALVWRQVLTSAQPSPPGARMPPQYADPATERTAEVLRVLEESTLKNFGDGYMVEMPLGLFFDESGRLTDVGKNALARIANHLRALPYDIFVQPSDRQHVNQALLLSKHLATEDRLDPWRLGIGVRDDAPGLSLTVRFVFVPRS